MAEPHVLIVGGGFGGLGTAQGLKRAAVRVTLVDRANHHLFQPLLYQVATASLSPSDIAEPIRTVLRRHANVRVRLAEVEAVDLAGKRVRIREDDGDVEWIAWDKLVLAAGTSHSYFGHDDWRIDAPGLKTMGDALEMRRRILAVFERAEWETERPELRRKLMTFVVIGGGATGVELAGALAEIAFRTFRKDFRNIDTTTAKVILLEGGPALLPSYPPDLQEKAKRQLEAMGVDVRLGSLVTRVDAGGVDVGGTRIDSGLVLWAAGVRGEPVARTLEVPLDKAGRVDVAADCSIPGHPDAFVIGDLAVFRHGPGGQPLPGVAQVAMQMGAFVAKAIRADVDGQPRATFRYLDKGNMATIGRSRAVVDLVPVRLHVSGLLAWLLWAFIHIAFLITYRNRLVVMTKWAIAWFTFERASRLIWSPSLSSPWVTGKRKEPEEVSPGRPGTAA